MAKAMSLGDFAKLKRLMGMTMSDNVHEAANAISLANRLLKANELTWDDVLGRSITASVPDYRPQKSYTHPVREYSDVAVDEQRGDIDINKNIEASFKILKGKVRGSFAEFIADLERHYEKDKYLSPNRRAALFKAAREEVERVRK